MWHACIHVAKYALSTEAMYRKIVQEERCKNIKSTEIEWITFIFKDYTILLQMFILKNPLFT